MSRSIEQELIDEILLLREEGLSWSSISKQIEVPTSTLHDWKKKGIFGTDTDLATGAPVLSLEDDCKSSNATLASYAKRLRTAQQKNRDLQKIINGSVNYDQQNKQVISAIEEASKRVQIVRKLDKGPKIPSEAQSATAEILFSDLQVGKVGQHYNTPLAKRAMAKYGKLVMEELKSKEFMFERIILACLGDTVEDHLKHGTQSSVSTDTGLAEQMADAIELLWCHVIQPIGALGIPFDIICVAGNHGADVHKGFSMFKPGLFSYDYTIYKALEGYCKVAGWAHVNFIIPEGAFAYLEIYGRTAVYEHGYFNTATEKSLLEQKAKRGRQIKRHVEYFRCGDMHHLVDYNNGAEVVNGAFFGVDSGGVEYSGIIGYSSIPGQKMMVHTRENSIGRNTIKKNINIQVADGY